MVNCSEAQALLFTRSGAEGPVPVFASAGCQPARCQECPRSSHSSSALVGRAVVPVRVVEVRAAEPLAALGATPLRGRFAGHIPVRNSFANAFLRFRCCRLAHKDLHRGEVWIILRHHSASILIGGARLPRPYLRRCTRDRCGRPGSLPCCGRCRHRRESRRGRIARFWDRTE